MLGRWGKRAGLAVLAPALLAACSPAPKPVLAANISVAPAPAPPPKPAKPHVFTLNTPVDHIVADPRGKAVLDRDIPGLMADKHYPMFEDMSLSEIALLSHGRLTKSKLELVKSDLIEISLLTPDPASVAVIPPEQ